MISIRECLEIMHSGAQFSAKVVAFDKRRQEKSGKIIEIPCGVLVWGELEGKPKRQGERAMTDLEKSLLAPPVVIAKRPNHQANYTRNVRMVVQGLKTEVMVKIHPALIIEFNGKKTTA